LESEAAGVVVETGTERVVSFDCQAGTKAPIPSAVRAAMMMLEGSQET
jgi:hypothetical protein